DEVRPVGAQRLHRVLERLALLDARAARDEVDDLGAEGLGGELEGGARAGGGLVEEVQHAPAAQRGHLLDLALADLGERLRAVQDALDARAVEVLDGEQVPHHAPAPAHAVRSGPASASRRLVIVTSSIPSSSATRTFTRSLRCVGRFLPT